MSKARKSLMAFMILVGTCVAPMAALQSMGQELTSTDSGEAVSANTTQSSGKKGGGFVDIVFGSGVVGMLLALPVMMSLRTVFRIFVQKYENI